MNTISETANLQGIAIIGMAGKFPGVENIYEYWESIKQGKELLTRFSEKELIDKGVSEKLLKDVNFVPVSGLVNSAEHFDSAFFGFTPREADLTDPQHRKFLEVCYEALEHSGTSPDKFKGSIGVFAGCSMNNYLIKNLLQHPDLLNSIGEIQAIVNNDKDFLTTKVSYKLNLTGPSFDIQTACSTSLVAIHEACQNLLNFQCDIALGGGVHLMSPRGEGYVYAPGSIESPEGTCKPFDKDAKGTIFSEGIGVVVLKRLEDAIADKDEIWAVIKSTAINNDGFVKVGYMAPSINGQSEVIALAQRFAEIDPRTITLVEAHGTGTNLGDPIEIAALSKTFRKFTNDQNFCAIGSVKGNIGHCDVAAGVAGLIKSVLALKYKILPPSINYNTPNPELNIDKSPFYVNTTLQAWEVNEFPRRAAVSSFGFGGTNAHCILEEWTANIPVPSEKDMHILPLSAKSQDALEKMTENFISELRMSSNNIADIAYTLQKGRNDYGNRAVIYGKSIVDILNSVENENRKNIVTGKVKFDNAPVIFMFTGQGSQYVNMAKGLYDNYSLFRNIVDEADRILKSKFNIPIIDLLYNNANDDKSKSLINLTSNTQPLLFVIQYATACLLSEFGIFPKALIGHSIGELTAATFAGVFSFDDALSIVANRGRIMQEQIPGSMLAVNLSTDKLRPYLSSKIELSLQNAPNYCVVSGTHQDILDFEAKLKLSEPNVHTTVLKTSHAFHSQLMEPALEPFKTFLKDIQFEKPEIPLISNVTGQWITDDEAMSGEYWAKHIRNTVYFSKGVNQLLKDFKNPVFFEIGPGNSLSMLLSQYDGIKNAKTISTIRHPMTLKDDTDVFMQAIGDYWVNGGKINWDDIYADEDRYKVALPTYPFERKRHWLGSKSTGLYHKTEVAPNESVEFTQAKSDKVEISLMHERPNLASKFVAPATDIELAIVNIWEQLLGIKGIGTEDNFFTLGGHSLLASQVIIRLNENLQVKLPFESIFKAPTIKLLISTYSLKAPESNVIKQIDSLKDKTEFPLSQAQQRLWILDQIEQNNPAYNIPFTFRIIGDLRIDKFNKAFKLLFERHKILKSVVSVNENKPLCKILNIDPEVNLIDFSGKINLDKEIQEFLKNDIRTPFDIKTGPLYRIFLLQLSKNEFIFHLNVHHIVFDGWSWGVFTSELNEIYNSLLNETSSKLPIPELQYFDFSNWQLSQKDEIPQSSIDFWIERLKDAPAELKFPYDKKRPQVLSGYGGRVAIQLNKEISEKLKLLSTCHDSTLFMTLLSSFGILMSIYAGEEDICIGSPVANRTKSTFEKLVGFFVNTVVFRLKIDKNLPFKDILKYVREDILKTLEHQEISFEKLVEIIQPERQVNINPIYQVMFAWQNAPRPPISLNGTKSDRYIIHEAVSPQDITFYMWENEGIIEGEIEFNSDILLPESIVHLKNNFVQLLSEIVSKNAEPVKNLDIISEYTQKALDQFNQTDTQVPEKLLHELFEESAKKYPENIAVITSGKKLTYRELDIESNRLANFLSKYEVKNKFIGVSLQRSEKMLIAILAILKAGACYLPLDPEFPDERLKYILKDSNAKLLLTTTNLKNKFAGIELKTVLLDDLGIKYTLTKNTNPNISVDKESLAYIIYTSGSTGNPKGVKVPHRAVVNFICSMSKIPGISSDDILLAVTTLSFDISVLEMFLPISYGASVYIANNAETNDGRSLISLIENQNISILQATPATWNLLIMSGWTGNTKLKALCGGEAIQPRLVKELLPKVKELWNMYGPTETTVWSTCYHITNSDLPVYVGNPIDNTQIYILNSDNKLLPQGVFGEVAIGGLGVTKGYHLREELTKEKFIPGPDVSIIYKTGDSGRILSTNSIELVGRIDNQIKLRGFRIEPGEIETIIGRETGVKEVVVKVHKFSEMDERLVAFLTNEPNYELDVELIKKRISAKLPSYMIPSAFEVLNDFPRTPNGKIDKKALVYKNQSKVSKTIVKPQNIIEEQILHVWKDVLKIEEISIEDNFFNIGGHSLLAIDLVSKVDIIYKNKVDLRRFFDSPTIKGMSEHIQSEEILDNKLKQKGFIKDSKEIIKGEL